MLWYAPPWRIRTSLELNWRRLAALYRRHGLSVPTFESAIRQYKTVRLLLRSIFHRSLLKGGELIALHCITTVLYES